MGHSEKIDLRLYSRIAELSKTIWFSFNPKFQTFLLSKPLINLLNVDKPNLNPNEFVEYIECSDRNRFIKCYEDYKGEYTHIKISLNGPCGIISGNLRIDYPIYYNDDILFIFEPSKLEHNISEINHLKVFDRIFQGITPLTNVGYSKWDITSNTFSTIGLWYENLEELSNNVPSSLEDLFPNMHPNDRAKTIQNISDGLDSLQKDDICIERENRIINPDKSIKWIFHNIVIVNRNNSFVINQLTIDITNRKNLCQELKVAKDKSISAENIKSAFITNINHEIRTPLNSIIGFSELLIDSCDEKQKKEYVQYIRRNNDLLLKNINHLISKSLLDKSVIPFFPTEVKINKLLEEIINDYSQYQTDYLNISLYPHIEDIYILIDKYRLEKILRELMDNAIKFTPNGSISIGYRILPERFIEFFVIDSGIGISREVGDRIFEQFFKADSFTEGLGLGLTTCKILAEQLSGKILVDSHLGIGSRFSLKIPCMCLQSRRCSHQHLCKTEPQINVNSLILVIEDDDNDYKYLHMMLKGHCDIIRATNRGIAALLLKEYQPDVILIDEDMENNEGGSVVKFIRESNTTIPILFIAGDYSEDNRCHAVVNGCTGVLFKHQLSTHLLKWLNNLYPNTIKN